MSDNIEPLHYEQKYGRTWADVFSSGAFWLFIATLVVVAYFVFRDFEIKIPAWIFVSIAASLAFVPFLMNRAKEDASLVVVVDGTNQMTEYRIGRRYPFEIEGNPLYFSSKSGVQRIILTEIDIQDDGVVGTGSQLAEFTSFDYIRDMTTLQRLSKTFTEHLKAERTVREMVGLQVEQKVSEYSDTWLKMLYGVLDPSEIESLLNDALNTQETVKEYEVGGEMFDLSESENS